MHADLGILAPTVGLRRPPPLYSTTPKKNVKTPYSRAKDSMKQQPGTNPEALGPASLPNQDNPPGSSNPGVVDSWPGLKLLMRVLGSASGMLAPLKVVIDGFSDLVEVFECASADNNNYKELRKTLDALLEALSRYLSHGASQNMSMSMINLCTGIKSEIQLVEQMSKRGGLRRRLEAIENPGQVLECYQRIQGYLERLTLNANLSMWETVDRIEREARLRQLSPTNSAVYDSAKSEEIQRRACTAGTREDEIAKLLAWAYNNEGAGVYWMNGMAGTGKTTIAYSLCAELKTSGLLAASFFCSRLIPECRDVKLIFPAIAYQLARFSFPFWFALSKVLEADPDVHTRILKTQFERLLAEPLLEVKHTLPTHFIVVIDALDECDNENSIGQILDMLLSQTSTFRLPIRFLLSSRPEPQIYPRMTAEIGIGHHTRLVLHELDEAKVRRDIEIYLKAELEDLGFTLTQLASLASHSGVLFIYASTAARYIKGGLRFKQHETRLSMILGLVPPSKNGKDRDIDTLYMSILTSAFGSRDLDESDQELMRTVVDAVVCAREPLTIAALAGLLGFEDPDVVEALLGPLRSVLNISENSGLVTILHASFPDFMCNRERSAPFHCDIQTTNDRIARDCFRVMAMNELQFNICGLESSHLLDRDVPDLDNRANRAIPMQLLYACHHWMTHLEIKGQHDPQRELMHEFLSKRLLVWMEVLNVKGSMHLGPGIMQRAEDWSRTHDCSQDTIDLAHDAWRFVTMYAGHSVSQSTPHIYISMLPFWPESASVSKYYRNRMRGAIRAHGSAMTRRQLALLATWPFVDYIRSVCLSPDGTLIAYAMTSSVHVIDGTTGRAILGPLEHADEVNSISFSPDGALLVSGAEDKTVKVWRSIDGELAVGPLTGHTDLVSTVAFSPDGKCVFSGSRDGTVCIWSLETGRMVTAVPQSQDPRVWSISVSPDGSRIASAHNDGTIQVWSTESGQILLGPLTGHTKCIRSVCFSPDGMRLASGSDDHTIRLWSNLNDQIHADVLEGHTDLLCSVAFSPDGKQLVSGSVDDTVRLWDVEGTPQLARVFTGHTNVVYCVRFSSDGARIVSSSGDNTIRLWDARSQGLLDTPFQAHTQAVTSIAFSHDGSRIVSGSNDGIVYVWDKKSGQVAVGPMKGHTSWVNSVGLSPDESRIVSGSKDKTLQLWDAYTGQAVGKPLTGHSGTVFSVCFSSDGALIASGSADTTIRLWDAKSGQPIGNPLMAHTGWVHSVCFSPDSLRLVSGSDDATILVWDVNSREPALRLKGHLSWVMAVCVSPDGNRIASGSNDTAVRLWDANDGRPVVGLLLGHTARVRSVCFSPDSSYVVSGSEDKTIRLWDARSGQTVGSPFTGHTDLVRLVVFSPDGGQIVSGSGTDDCSIRVWDVADLVQPQESKDDDSKNTEPSHAYQSWVLQDDGWVVDPQSRLLAWVPPDLHASLMSPRNNLLILSKGSVKLELESAKLGESWTECYEPAS